MASPIPSKCVDHTGGVLNLLTNSPTTMAQQLRDGCNTTQQADTVQRRLEVGGYTTYAGQPPSMFRKYSIWSKPAQFVGNSPKLCPIPKGHVLYHFSMDPPSAIISGTKPGTQLLRTVSCVQRVSSTTSFVSSFVWLFFQGR